jgi:hypothetical protein
VGPGQLDQPAAVRGDGRGRGLGGGKVRGFGRPRPGQLGGVGVETETDLAAALVDERREPIREARRQGLSRP